MKKLILILSLFSTQIVTSQTYQLLPDSCTFCMHLSSTGSGSSYNNYYQLTPGNDTLFLGNSYMKITIDPSAWSYLPTQQFALRQEGNQLLGIVKDSINEFLIMDFDAQINDTIYNLYSEGITYNARVIVKDSVLVNNNVYHHFMQLEGLGYYQYNYWNDFSWEFTWNERALCGMNNTGSSVEMLGGVIYNVPTIYAISTQYVFPEYCTLDPTYNTPPSVSCNYCIPQTSSIVELKNDKVNISPNPVRDEVHIKILTNELYNVEIIDSKGGKHYVGETYSNFHTINVSELESGLYFIYLYSNQSLIAEKFIKL